jgi:glycine cleavage system aminomethyltransferase T
MAGRIPQQGRLSLTPMLAQSGKIIGDFTVSCLSETEFQLTASYGAQGWHSRWFEQHEGPGVTRREHLGFAIGLYHRRAEGARASGPLSPAAMSAPRRSSSWTCAG